MSSARVIPEPTPAEVLERLACELERDRPDGLTQARAISAALEALPAEEWRREQASGRTDASVWCARCGMLAGAHGVSRAACAAFVRRDVEAEDKQMIQDFLARSGR